MKIAHRQPARGLRPAIGHAHHHHFVEAQDVADARFHHHRIKQRQFGGAGIAEYMGDAFGRQNIEQYMLAGARRVSWAAHGIISPSVTAGKRTLPSSRPVPGR